MPSSSGPILFCASSPIEWQGRHLWNEISPLATSSADAVQVDAAIHAAATINVLIISSPFRLSCRSRPMRPKFAPQPFKRPERFVSTAKIADLPRGPPRGAIARYGRPFPAILTTHETPEWFDAGFDAAV